MQRVRSERIRAGYRLIDTALPTETKTLSARLSASNREGICTREELFITSKMGAGYAELRHGKGCNRSFHRNHGCRLSRPLSSASGYERLLQAWRAMEDAYKEGKLAPSVHPTLSLCPHQFRETVEIKPMVNQIETHPYFTQEQSLEVMEYYGVVPEAWSPLGGGRYSPWNDEC